MYTHYHSGTPLNDSKAVLGRLHRDELAYDIERVHLAKLARAARPRRIVRLFALFQWLRARLPVRARGLPVSTPSTQPGGLAPPSAGQT